MEGLTGLEEEDGNLAEVEVDEMLRLVGDIAAEVATNDAMPGRIILLVELLLDISGDVLLDVIFIQSLNSCVNCIVLHLFGHVRVLHHRFLVAATHLRMYC